MSRSHTSPSTVNGKKNLRQLCNECGLLLGSEHQISVSLFGGGKGGKNSAVHAKVNCAHVGTFLSACQAERNTAEIIYGHGILPHGSS